VFRPRLLLLALLVALAGAAAPAEAATVVYTDIDQFRADAHGREVDWNVHAVGAVAKDEYKPLGMLLGAPGRVSQSGQSKVFDTPNSTTTTLTFVVPGTSTSALTRGFGAVFADPAHGKLELLDANGQVLKSVIPQASFLGVLLDDGRVARVRITGSPLGTFLYAEPMQDVDGDGIAENDPDADNDGVPNARDAFPFDKKESVDTDGDGIGDNKDTDDDNDGLPDTTEARLGTDPKRADTDGDGVSDSQDNCPTVANADQADGNGDGRGDACSDLFPPVLSKLAFRPAKFRPGSKNGTRVSFRLSEAAAVELTVVRIVRGHRRRVGGTIERDGTAGMNFVRFIGRIGGRDLKAGRYVLLATAEDEAGNASFQTGRARFTVLG
jgi:hypothetical protein